MVTRRDALVLIGTLPAGVALSRSEAATTIDVPLDLHADRQLTLMLGDDLERQYWLYAGQHYVEHRDRIVVFEDERLRLNVVNDTAELRTLTFDSARIQLAPGQVASLELTIDKLEAKVIRDTARNVTRVIEVRPSYQAHAMVPA